MKSLQSFAYLGFTFLAGVSHVLSANEMVTLQSQDGEDFKVEVKVAKQSKTLEDLIEAVGIKDPIPIPNIVARTLVRVVDLMTRDMDRKQAISLGKSQKSLTGLIRELWSTLPNSDLITLAIAFNYLDVKSEHPSDVLNAVLKLYGDRVFGKKELTVLESKTTGYNAYVNENLALPPDLRRMVIGQSLRSIDRLFLNDTKDRRLAAIQNTPLNIAQIVAYIAKHNTAKLGDLLEHMQTALTGWLPLEQIPNTIYFGPWPTEIATWPQHCPLPGHPDYNMYGDDTPDARFVDNGDGTITDICTRLTWEKTASSERFSRRRATIHCARLKKASVKDWRLPALIELQSIVNHASGEPAINGIFQGKNDLYWSITSSGKSARVVDFKNGNVDAGLTTNGIYVRCVRSSKSEKTSETIGAVNHYRFADDTVIDRFTGLEWQKALSDGEGKDHDNAQVHCSEVNIGGHHGRVPMVKELSTLIDFSRSEPAIDDAGFPNTPSADFWSQSPRVGIANRSWKVGFRYGKVSIADMNDVNRVRCAR